MSIASHEPASLPKCYPLKRFRDLSIAWSACVVMIAYIACRLFHRFPVMVCGTPVWVPRHNQPRIAPTSAYQLVLHPACIWCILVLNLMLQDGHRVLCYDHFLNIPLVLLPILFLQQQNPLIGRQSLGKFIQLLAECIQRGLRFMQTLQIAISTARGQRCLQHVGLQLLP